MLQEHEGGGTQGLKALQGGQGSNAQGKLPTVLFVIFSVHRSASFITTMKTGNMKTYFIITR